MGLNVVYNLVTHKLNGEIKCTSSPNQGARFVLRVPKEPPDFPEELHNFLHYGQF